MDSSYGRVSAIVTDRYSSDAYQALIANYQLAKDRNLIYLKREQSTSRSMKSFKHGELIQGNCTHCGYRN